MKQKMKIFGKLDPFFETGSEGIYWSLQSPYLPSYDGLFILNDEDHLEVLNNDNSVFWSGIIHLEYRRNYTPYPGNPEYGQQSVKNYWVHGLQCDMSPDDWADMFFNQKRAVLTTKIKDKPHPFLSDPDQLEKILENYPFKKGVDLYRSSLNNCLYFNSDGSWNSIAKHWDFTLEETIKLVGSPQSHLIERWMTYPKASNETLIPPNLWTFVRVALTYSIYGDLEVAFTNKEDKVKWLNSSSINGRSPKEIMMDHSYRNFIDIKKLSKTLIEHSEII